MAMKSMKELFLAVLCVFALILLILKAPGLLSNSNDPGQETIHGLHGQARGGQDETKGYWGERGSEGPSRTGAKKETKVGVDSRNWKQCVWRRGYDKGFGLIQECPFTKRNDSTALHVVYQGNLQISSCSYCCKRWFITFNGAECDGPMPIDVALSIPDAHAALHVPGNIDGICENIPQGNYSVGINIGNCTGYPDFDSYTGWMSVSRLIIEEIPKAP